MDSFINLFVLWKVVNTECMCMDVLCYFPLLHDSYREYIWLIENIQLVLGLSHFIILNEDITIN
jgi:hypothetical protein